MTVNTIICPHCAAANASGASFCESCGKALPSATASAPRVVSGDALPTSAAGQALVSAELSKLTKRAAYTLLAVGILQATCGAILVGVLASVQRGQMGDELNLPFLLALQFGGAAIFIGLFFWARKSPLPASITGLVIYATLVAINVVTSVSQLGQQEEARRPGGIGGLGIGWLDIVIMIILAQGIQAGLKHKRLLEGRS